jgi:hypothetical protein
MLVKLAAAAIKAACIDIQLVQERDGKHQLPASTVFTEPEIETLEALVPTLEGKTERQKNPHPVRSLARARWVVARLGGWRNVSTTLIHPGSEFRLDSSASIERLSSGQADLAFVLALAA